jgi:hypothetical protein
VTGDAPDCGGTGSARTSEAASGEGETSVAMEARGPVEAAEVGTDVDVVGEVGEGSFLVNAFFSLARLFWNHTYSAGGARGKQSNVFFSAVKKTMQNGV